MIQFAKSHGPVEIIESIVCSFTAPDLPKPESLHESFSIEGSGI